MLIPKELDDRYGLFQDILDKCSKTRAERGLFYDSMRSWYLFGADNGSEPAAFNKIFPSIDTVSSFLFSGESNQFSLELYAERDQFALDIPKVPALNRCINEHWEKSGFDLICQEAIPWAMTYGIMLVTPIWKDGALRSYLVDPANFGVLQEHITEIDDQEAMAFYYTVSKDQLFRDLHSHPRRDKIIEECQPRIITEGERISSGVGKLIIGNTYPLSKGGNVVGSVEGALGGNYDPYAPRPAEPVIRMAELWVWNDEANEGRGDYQIVTCVEEGPVIYDRNNFYLQGRHRFVPFRTEPQYDYFYGRSAVKPLIGLQAKRDYRMGQIQDLLDRQVNPPTSVTGYSGIVDEKNFALNMPGGLIQIDDMQAKVQRHAPDVPSDVFAEIRELDQMFAEATGLYNVMTGKGESGVRSKGHASELARLGSSRPKARALMVQDSLERLATLVFSLLQKNDDTVYIDDKNQSFIASQLTCDYLVRVDAHSSSPLFSSDMNEKIAHLFQAKAIDRRSLIELMNPPKKEILLERLKEIEAREQEQAKQSMLASQAGAGDKR